MTHYENCIVTSRFHCYWTFRVLYWKGSLNNHKFDVFQFDSALSYFLLYSKIQLSVAKPNLNLLLTTNKTKYSASLIWTIAKTKPKQSNWKPDFLRHLIKNCCNTAIDITIDWTGIENYNSTGCMVSGSTYHRHCWCTRHGKVQGLLKWTHQCSV